MRNAKAVTMRVDTRQVTAWNLGRVFEEYEEVPGGLQRASATAAARHAKIRAVTITQATMGNDIPLFQLERSTPFAR